MGGIYDTISKSLSNRILAVVIISISVVMGVEIILDLYFDKRDRIELMETLSLDLAASTYSGIKYPMSVGDSAAVENVLSDIRKKMEGIEVLICDDEQRITWSTHEEKIATSVQDTLSNKVPKEALANILRTGSAPPGSFEDIHDGKRHIVLMEPIFNESDCYSCHDSAKEIIGGMIVRANVERTLQTVAAARNRTIFATTLCIFAIIALIYAMTLRFIRRPLMHLTNSVQKVAAGDLDFSIQVYSSDEIGALAKSFNIMTRKLKSARDEIERWAHTLEDLVEERTEQLKRAQANAIQTEKMASMGRLAAIVAHEINNPLAGIRTYAKLLNKRSHEVLPCTDSKYLRYLETIEAEAARCGDIVRGLLQFARPSKPRFRRHDINRIIEETLRLVQHQIDLMSVEVVLNLAPPPLEANCDDQKIKQALVALLLNSCDAVQKETGSIKINSRLMSMNKSIEIAIQDNGVGMDEETRLHMFEPFFTTKLQEHLQEQEPGTNTGLGVSVVYEIVKSHQGSIYVDSELGEGSIITIILPQEPDLEG